MMYRTIASCILSSLGVFSLIHGLETTTRSDRKEIFSSILAAFILFYLAVNIYLNVASFLSIIITLSIPITAILVVILNLFKPLFQKIKLHMGKHVKDSKTREVLRKLFHLLSLVLIITYIYYGEEITIQITYLALIFFYLTDILRFWIPKYYPFAVIADLVLRKGETEKIGPHTYYVISASLALMLFSMYTAVIALIAAAMGDASAAIAGRTLGKHKLPWKKEKTIEGSIAAFATTFTILILFTPIEKALIGAVLLLIIDLIDPPINDNLLNGLAIAAGLTLFNLY